MYGGHRAADVDAGRQRLRCAEHAALGDELPERPPFEQLHPQADGSLGRIGAVNRDDVRVAHAREPARFGEDVGGRGAIGGQILADDLQRDLARQLRIPRAVDDAEAAAAELSADLERAPASQRGTRILSAANS